MTPDYVPPIVLLDHIWHAYKRREISRAAAFAQMREVYASTGTSITDTGTDDLLDSATAPGARRSEVAA